MSHAIQAEQGGRGFGVWHGVYPSFLRRVKMSLLSSYSARNPFQTRPKPHTTGGAKDDVEASTSGSYGAGFLRCRVVCAPNRPSVPPFAFAIHPRSIVVALCGWLSERPNIALEVRHATSTLFGLIQGAHEYEASAKAHTNSYGPNSLPA